MQEAQERSAWGVVAVRSQVAEVSAKVADEAVAAEVRVEAARPSFECLVLREGAWKPTGLAGFATMEAGIAAASSHFRASPSGRSLVENGGGAEAVEARRYACILAEGPCVAVEFGPKDGGTALTLAAYRVARYAGAGREVVKADRAG